jgi:hypothetical protein
MKPASLLAVLVFALVSIAHLARLIFQMEVVVSGVVIPMWVSVVGLFVTGRTRGGTLERGSIR